MKTSFKNNLSTTNEARIIKNLSDLQQSVLEDPADQSGQGVVHREAEDVLFLGIQKNVNSAKSIFDIFFLLQFSNFVFELN